VMWEVYTVLLLCYFDLTWWLCFIR